MSNKNRNGTISSVVKQEKHLDGLFTCMLEHQVVDTKTNFKWEGPKIPPEEWDQVLAFFQWTYDTYHSESQVRAYVNIKEKTWRFWAYPQEAQTGMSARELGDLPEFKEQRAQFGDDWIYFGTVHHHCNMGAFQSSTDEENEINQDGLHITVGNMGGDRYTVHDRFYLNKNLITHDLSWFWDIGDPLGDVPKWAATYLPGNIKDMLARGQQLVKVDKAVTFPEIWKTNIIEKKVVSAASHYSGGLGYQESNITSINSDKHMPYNILFDLRKCEADMIAKGKELGFDKDQVIKIIGLLLQENPIFEILTEALYAHDVSLKALNTFMNLDYKPKNGEKGEKAGGVPDYEGPNYAKEDARWPGSLL